MKSANTYVRFSNRPFGVKRFQTTPPVSPMSARSAHSANVRFGSFQATCGDLGFTQELLGYISRLWVTKPRAHPDCGEVGLKPSRTGLALVSCLVLAVPAAAQAPGPADMQTIGDWTVRCFPGRSISPCDVYQQLNEKASHRLVLAVSIAYVPSQGRHTMQIMVPLGVSISRGAQLQTKAFTPPVLHYHHCDSAGCYIELIMPDVAIKSLYNGGDGAKITIMADNGRPLDLPISLRGFAEAHTKMVGLAESKANVPAAPPVEQTAH